MSQSADTLDTSIRMGQSALASLACDGMVAPSPPLSSSQSCSSLMLRNLDYPRRRAGYIVAAATQRYVSRLLLVSSDNGPSSCVRPVALDASPGDSNQVRECDIPMIGSFLSLWEFFLAAVFSALRIFAISDRNLTLAAAVFLLGITPIATNIVRLIRVQFGETRTAYYTVNTALRVECVPLIMVSPQLSLISPKLIAKSSMLLLCRIPVVAADALVLLVTALKTYRGVAEARRIHRTDVSLAKRLTRGTSLAECLIRDALTNLTQVFYTSPLCVLTRALLTMNISRIFVNFLQVPSVIDPFMNNIPLVLIGRFMINLRRIVDSRASPEDGHFSSLQFAVPYSRLGNIGETLDQGQMVELEDEHVETSPGQQ
ncbi:uncharacterized protein PHACADRAFT_30587 [Phanerochaete carnosa HHB-10118-sp]|uniref:Uncharacterized protein n=1 Tax=Phanerochaete carnosa (strain HHB-10118-sp) TaxID=650164 RepID=K5W3A2_PHACS|nr:uncharacterized protein PHACADRAFT_30587 [Phanerochaete carnosa HHB-10118-sp]EKM53620.1 hypothetical protein PHACADRAFT_30587 [Phanerochaete carnosa HHB-10118-sp]